MRNAKHLASFFLLAGVLLAAPDARAIENGPEFQSVADVGIGFIDEDVFFLLLLEQGFNYKAVDLRLSAPLRFRIKDRDPADDGVLREQDWDEPSDYARILRRLTIEHEWDEGFFDFHFGELSGVSIGHGALVDAYYNSVDMDRYQGGAFLKTGYLGNGLELMVENVVAPELLMGRAFVAPLAWFSDKPVARRLEVGFFAGADINAPLRFDPEVTSTVIPAIAGDLSFRIVDREKAVVMPYVEFGVMDGSVGFHGGASAHFTFSGKKNVTLGIRGEYRRVTSDYHPAVFNPFYEYNRYHFPIDVAPGADAPTLADHLAESADPPDGNGMMADVTFAVEEALRFGLRYDRQGMDRPHWFLARVELFPWDRFSLAAYYGGQDIEGGTGLFSQNSIVAAALRTRIWGPITAFTEFTRRNRQIPQSAEYFNETGFGVGFFAEF